MTLRKSILASRLLNCAALQTLAAATAPVEPTDPTSAFKQAGGQKQPLKRPHADQHTHAVQVQERAARSKKLAQRVRNGFIVTGR